MLRKSTAAVAFTAAIVAGGVADAQIGTRSRQSTPFIIHAPSPADVAPAEERVASRGQPLLVQRTTSIRAARLGADTPSLSGFRKTKVFTADTPMFGIYADNGWAYCAVAETTATWWAGDEFVCYEDADADGAFETAMHSGAPFLGVPLFVFELGRRQALPAPAPYRLVDEDQGPVVDFVITPRVNRHSNRRTPEVPPVVTVTLQGGFRKGPDNSPATIGGWARTVRIDEGKTAEVEIMGAKFEILGVGADDSVRYRVLETAPDSLHRITMGVTTTTTYTPIFIPR